ncbi:hypothetical protein D3C76_1865410 [compost metagenome]
MAELIHGLHPVGGFTEDLALESLPINKTPQPFPDNRLIIHDHDVIHAILPPDLQECEG